MCCCCEAEGLILPLLALLYISGDGTEVAGIEPPQSRRGPRVSQRHGYIMHSFFPVLLLPPLPRKLNSKSEKTPLKTGNTFGFIFQGDDGDAISFPLNHHSRHFQAFLRQLFKTKLVPQEWKAKSCFLKEMP